MRVYSWIFSVLLFITPTYALRPFFEGTASLKHKQSSIHHVIASFLKKDATLLEAGAHIGKDTIRLARALPHGSVIACEPHPGSLKRLKKSIAQVRNVQTLPVALGGETGKARFHIREKNPGGSSLIKHQFATKYSIETPVYTLDALCETFSLPQINALWLDLEGMELATLQASPQTLAKVSLIYTETNSKQNASNYAPNKDELFAFLQRNGFTLVAHWYGSNQGDALFVRK